MKSMIKKLLLFPLNAQIFNAGSAVFRWLRILPPKYRALGERPQSVLVVNITSYIGDTAMMIPALDKLREALPHATIDVITSSAMAPLLDKVSAVDQVYGVSPVKTKLPIWRNYQKLYAMVQLVRQELYKKRYDLAILPRWGSDPELSPYLASMTSAAILVGHDSSEDRGLGDLFPSATNLLTQVQRGGIGLPEAVREMRVLQACAICPEIDVALEERHASQGVADVAAATPLPPLLEKFGLTGRRYAVLSPGASKPERRWPADRFAKVANDLNRSENVDVVILGGVADQSVGEIIVDGKAANFHNLTGKTSLLETIAILSGAEIIVANDSGLAHWGAGLGILTVVLSPSPLSCKVETVSSPLRCRPVGPRISIVQPAEPGDGCKDLCTADTAHCILEISTQAVMDECLRRLNKKD